LRKDFRDEIRKCYNKVGGRMAKKGNVGRWVIGIVVRDG
jgi:hypothetical protein